MHICAWCTKVLSRENDTGEGDSHGICDSCMVLSAENVRCKWCRYYKPDSNVVCIAQYLFTSKNYGFIPIPNCIFYLKKVRGNSGYNYYARSKANDTHN